MNAETENTRNREVFIPAKLKNCLELLEYGFLRGGLHPVGVMISPTEKSL